MECEKCKDVGFIEYEAGLIVQFCDCGAGTKGLEKQRGTFGYPETPPGPIMNEQFQSGKTLLDTVIKSVEVFYDGKFHPVEEVKDDSDSGDKSDNQSTGGGDTSESKQPKKSKTKRKARKRAG